MTRNANKRAQFTACFAASLPLLTCHQGLGASTCRTSFNPKHNLSPNRRVVLQQSDKIFRCASRNTDTDTSISASNADEKKSNSKKSKTQHEHGLTLSRDMVLSHTRRNRALKLKRWARLSELDILDDLDVESPEDIQVKVWIVAQRIGESRMDIKILGKTNVAVPHNCDRCTTEYEAVSDGRFEVIIVGKDNESETDDGKIARYEDEAEAVEVLEQGIENIDLSEHVRDSVLLGFPSRFICSPDCKAPDSTQETSGINGQEENNDSWEQGLMGNQLLIQLKEQLKEQQQPQAE